MTVGRENLPADPVKKRETPSRASCKTAFCSSVKSTGGDGSLITVLRDGGATRTFSSLKSIGVLLRAPMSDGLELLTKYDHFVEERKCKKKRLGLVSMRYFWY